MPSESLLCANCHMTFSNPTLLYKHQARFCVGGPTNAPRQPPHEKLEQTPQERWDTRSAELRQVQKPGPSNGGQSHRTSSQLSSNSSMSIHLADEEPDRSPQKDYDHENRQRQLRMLVESHGRNLADLQSRNKLLAQQKQDIDQRLNAYPYPGVPTDFRQQQARNQAAMTDLRHHLDGQVGPIGGDTLVAEIISTREAYLRQAGNNAGMLATLADLEAEARNLASKHAKHSTSKSKHKHTSRIEDIREQLMAFELENVRLQDDLLMSQELNNERLRNVHTDAGYYLAGPYLLGPQDPSP